MNPMLAQLPGNMALPGNMPHMMMNQPSLPQQHPHHQPHGQTPMHLNTPPGLQAGMGPAMVRPMMHNGMMNTNPMMGMGGMGGMRPNMMRPGMPGRGGPWMR